MNNQHQVQEIVSNYFSNVSNDDFVKVVEALAYHIAPKSVGVIGIVNDFLRDNGLEKAYATYLLDMKEPKDHFMRSTGSDIQMIDMVKMSLVTESFNRMRRIDHTAPVEAEKVKITFGPHDSSVHIVGMGNKEYTLCGTLIDGDEVEQWSCALKTTDCRHCLEIVSMCKSIMP